MINRAFVNLSYIVAIIMVFTSCNSGNNNPLAFIPPDLSKAKDADVIEISKIEKETTHYHKLAVKDSFVVATGSDFEHTQHLFSKKTGEYLKSFAAIGRGPGEFVMGMTYVHFTTGNDSTYYIVHLPLSTVYTYKVKDIMSHSYPSKFTRLAPIPGRLVGQLAFSEIIPINDRIIATPGNKRKNNNLYELYDMNGTLLDTFALYPDIVEIKHKELISRKMFEFARIAVRPDGKRMVTGTNYGAYMGIYSLENDSITLLTENRYHIPQLYIKLHSRNGARTYHRHDYDITGFTSVTTSQDRIYAVYYGREFSSKDDLYYILEYDWDGNLLKTYRLDREIFDVKYDSKENRLYLLYGDYNEGDFRLGYMEV